MGRMYTFNVSCDSGEIVTDSPCGATVGSLVHIMLCFLLCYASLCAMFHIHGFGVSCYGSWVSYDV